MRRSLLTCVSTALEVILVQFIILWFSVWFTVQPQDFDGYVGEPAILYCKAEGLHPETKISYLWLKSSTPDGATNPLTVSEEDMLVIQSLNDSHYGYYICQASATNQVISSRTVSVSAKIRDACEGECNQY